MQQEQYSLYDNSISDALSIDDILDADTDTAAESLLAITQSPPPLPTQSQSQKNNLIKHKAGNKARARVRHKSESACSPASTRERRKRRQKLMREVAREAKAEAKANKSKTKTDNTNPNPINPNPINPNPTPLPPTPGGNGNGVCLDIRLHTRQADCLRELKKKEIVGYGGARGGGKSYLARAYAIWRAYKYDNTTHIIIRKSFPELERNHIIPLQKEIPKELYQYQERHHRFLLKNGSIIELAYIDSPKDLGKYQGAEYQTIIIDEATHHPEEIYRTMRACLRTTRNDIDCKMLLTSNPGGVGHAWYKRIFIDRNFTSDEKSGDYGFIQSLVYDNPSIIDNDGDYVKRLEALPERLRKAYLHGDWSVFEGQFFALPSDMAEDHWQLQQSDLYGRLYGSLDSGTAHATSFGLWYVDGSGVIHRLCSYLNNGNTIRDHAYEIKDLIESFPWTHGMYPEIIYADPAMWTQVRLNDYMTRSQIDEYIDVFADKPTQFVKANNSKPTGCELMRQLFAGQNGQPQVKYWANYNRSFVEGLTAVITDENNTEIYKKMDGDDAADEARYGIVGCYSKYNSDKQATHMKRKVQSYMRSRSSEQIDWYTV